MLLALWLEEVPLEPISEYFESVRFDGSLTFVNMAYFEDMILQPHSKFPKTKPIESNSYCLVTPILNQTIRYSFDC